MDDLIFRQDAIDSLQKCRKHCIDPFDSYHIDIQDAENRLIKVKGAQIDNKVHLCNSCMYKYPECDATYNDIIFGNNIGNDNICACKYYNPFNTERIEKKRKVMYYSRHKTT